MDLTTARTQYAHDIFALPDLTLECGIALAQKGLLLCENSPRRSVHGIDNYEAMSDELEW